MQSRILTALLAVVLGAVLPVDLVVEKGRIVDIVPVDPVSVASDLSEQPTRDLIVDAAGKYV